MNVSVYAFVYACVYACMYVCMHVCMYMCVYVCILRATHTITSMLGARLPRQSIFIHVSVSSKTNHCHTGPPFYPQEMSHRLALPHDDTATHQKALDKRPTRCKKKRPTRCQKRTTDSSLYSICQQRRTNISIPAALKSLQTHARGQPFGVGDVCVWGGRACREDCVAEG